MQRFGAIHRVRIHRLCIENRLTDIAKLYVYRMSEFVDRRRLMVPSNHDASSFLRTEVLGDDIEELRPFRRWNILSWPGTDLVRKRKCELLNLKGPHRQPMIR